MTYQAQIAAQVRLIRSVVPPPTRQQMHLACDLYETHAAKGLSPNAIADALGWTPGTACVVRRWSAERAAGIEPRVEVRL